MVRMSKPTFNSPSEQGDLRSDEALSQIQARSRYYFKMPEFAQLTGRPQSSAAAYLAVNRLSKRGRVVSATRRPAGYLIVPPEHQSFGSPPVTWWIDDCLRAIEPYYYVALLSAARHWGSSHYARQDVQVMLSRPHPPLTPGRLKVTFTAKKNIEATPTTVVKSGVAPWRVSSRAATLLDLIRHQSDIGGIEAIARVAKDLSRDLTRADLFASLDALDKVSTAQRLGFILDRLELGVCARHVATWLGARPNFRTSQPLERGTTHSQNTETDSCWKVRYDPNRLSILEEFK
jgi:predicted transcriptional regulator of viral defense system